MKILNKFDYNSNNAKNKIWNGLQFFLFDNTNIT